MRTETGRSYELEPPMARLVCGWLVDHLPTEALSEAVENLSTMYRFYWDRLSKTPPLPMPEAEIRAKVGVGCERPKFRLEED